MKNLSRNNIRECAKFAQEVANDVEIDEKYRPFLFLHILERYDGNIDVTSTPKVAQKEISKRKKNDQKTAPSIIFSLFNEGFFSEGKAISEILDRLRKDGFNFGNDNTRKALQRATYLRGEGNPHNRKYYQRIPPA